MSSWDMTRYIAVGVELEARGTKRSCRFHSRYISLTTLNNITSQHLPVCTQEAQRLQSLYLQVQASTAQQQRKINLTKGVVIEKKVETHKECSCTCQS
ncbi:hypothetical protein PAXRUDRAFT_832088 [Paxillus rubicundulus Ve08.2h10]|uniref:Uncharacterized protein n=1 Tax=Paxillus rubicundulus Ve08.2h10 TaxID=930991 RepID=A0A0D0DMD5_9AGAM|nr:hypothetical protein PAXRUDRAFT_832088 [Paxillus rubicundulus Ve08.2h10]